MAEKDKKKIEFYYEKMQSYRTYHVDGLIGGLTSKGNFFMDYFFENKPIPLKVTHEINESGNIGDITEQEDRISGIMRNVEFGLTMDINMAKSVVIWLNQKIEEHEKIFSQG